MSQRSRTVVNPRSSRTRRACTPNTALSAGASAQIAPSSSGRIVTWTWQSMNPGVTVCLERSTTLQPAGRSTVRPIAAIRPSRTRISIGPSAASARPSQTFPATSTTTLTGGGAATGSPRHSPDIATPAARVISCATIAIRFMSVDQVGVRKEAAGTLTQR